MSIVIKRLVGESYDFESGREMSKGFLLSNGVSERTVEATDAQINTVLELYAELAAGGSEQPTTRAPTGPAPAARPPQKVNGHSAPKASAVASQDGAEPGEEYADEHGTASL